MDDPLFRLVCVPAVLDEDVPSGWASALLREGEMALQAGEGGLEAIDAVAHALDAVVVSVLRTERTAAAQEQTVIAYAGSLPLVWIARAFSAEARDWARRRGPMTLLVEADRPLGQDDRQRVERFVALLGRQAE